MTYIDIKPITPAIGAEISGVDLCESLFPNQVNIIKQALLDHHVIFFRDQALTPEQQLRFARYFGKVQESPIGPQVEGYPGVTIADMTALPRGNGTDYWHTDDTYQANPPIGAILHGVKIPDVGGDTLWISLYAAYDALSESMKMVLEDLVAVHDVTKTYNLAVEAGLTDIEPQVMRDTYPPVEHPVVKINLETGRKYLYVNSLFTVRIIGLAEDESAALLHFLNEHVKKPDFQCRFKWETNSVAFWDNRVTQHYAVPDYKEQRVVHRVSLGSSDG